MQNHKFRIISATLLVALMLAGFTQVYADNSKKQQSDVVLSVTPAGHGITTFTYNFNPFSSNLLFPTQFGIYESLMVYNRLAGKVLPWLATKYAWGDKNTTLTFTLRKGVKWSDGKNFTSADVVFTFDLIKRVKGLAGQGVVAVKEGGYVESVTAPDAYTVVFKFKRVYTPGFYDIIAQNIVPEHIWKDVSDPVTFANTKNPVGTGPFTEVVMMKDQVYQVDRNPNYWQTGKPYVKGLRMPAFSGNDTVATMFANGDLDWTGQFFNNVDEAVLARNPKDLHCWWPPVTTDQLFMVNGTKAPFDDPVVRKAISMSFNRKMLIDIALQGKTIPSDVTALSLGFLLWKVKDPTPLGTWTDYNPKKANQMLDDAGYTRSAGGIRTNRDGKPWAFELLMVNGFSDWLAIAPTLKSSLQSIGFDITINNYSPPQAFQKWFKGDFDMSLFFGIKTDTPYIYYRNIMSSETYKPIGQFTGMGENMWRVKIPEADEQLKIFATSGNMEVQKKAAIELQKIFSKYAPVIPLWHAPTFYCYSTARVSGWASEANQIVATIPVGVNATGEQLIQMLSWGPK